MGSLQYLAWADPDHHCGHQHAPASALDGQDMTSVRLRPGLPGHICLCPYGRRSKRQHLDVRRRLSDAKGMMSENATLLTKKNSNDTRVANGTMPYLRCAMPSADYPSEWCQRVFITRSRKRRGGTNAGLDPERRQQQHGRPGSST